MWTITRRWQSALAACILLTSLLIPLRAQDKPAAVPLDRKTLDRQIDELLKVIINTGADIHNGSPRQGIPYNPAGCYRLYYDSLRALQPLLGHQPELQKAIDTGLADAERMPARTNREISERAFALRRIIDTVRAAIGPERMPAPAPLPKAASLWQQLGGEDNVKKVVNDWVALAAQDPTVNFTRGGKIKLTDAQVAHLKDQLVAFLSQVTGGPIKYKGKDMKEAHRGMAITNAEFDAAVVDLRKALEGRRVDPLVVQDVLKLVGNTRNDFVEVKTRPDENKLDDKKPGDKKSDGKSSGEGEK